ncbi:MAG TPA: stilbene synthase [Opitutales bacterium]|jgi:predicted naringenin-chalcone synthase|nr:stilbene synthase [Opitutales bacterium]
MFLHALANVVPEQRLTQRECWEILRRSPATRNLRPGSRALLEKVLTGDSGIETRHFAVGNLDHVFDLDAEALNHAFEREAPALGERALRNALAEAKLAPNELDALIVCTCTGYLCPGISSFVAERVGLRPDIFLQDIVGQGCGAAIPSLRSVSHVLAARPGAKVACLAVEICSAAFFLDDDPGVLISLCLFGDGASASIWNGRPGPTRLRCDGFDALHLPADRECLRFQNSGGKLRNHLDKTVPDRAAAAVRVLFERQNGTADNIGQVLAHAGGKKVIEAVGGAFDGKFALAESTAVLRQFGNMSSPSVMFALGENLKNNPLGDSHANKNADDLWLTSFGAGFSAHSCRLTRA